MKKAILVGTLCGALSFLALQAFTQGGGFGVADIAADPLKFWGRELSVQGIAGSVHQGTRLIGGTRTPTLSFSLYEPGSGRSKTGRRYVYVSVPASAFRYQPAKDQPISITGVLKAPDKIGSIEP